MFLIKHIFFFFLTVIITCQLSASPKAYYNLKKGTSYLKQKDYPLAAQYYRAALLEKIDLWEAHYNLGLCFHYMGKPGEALEHLRKALRFNPEDVRIKALIDMIGAQTELTTISVIEYYDFGLKLFHAQDYENAVKYFEYFTSVNQENPQAYYYLGVCYHRLGSFLEAKANLKKALDIKSNHKNTLDFIKTSTEYQDMLVQRFQIKEFDMPQRRPVLAGLFSVIPGGGQLYCGNQGRAIFYLCATTALITYGNHLEHPEGNENTGATLKSIGITLYAVNIVEATITAVLFNRKARIEYYQKKNGMAVSFNY